MSENTKPADVGDAPPEYAGIRPSGHYLMLMLRAAVVDDGRGGPWLYVYRTATAGGTPLYTHHISTHPPLAYSEQRAVMITGDEVLGFAAEHAWPSVTDPSAAELRALSTYAVECERIDQWAMWPLDWHRDHMAPERRKARRARRRDARAYARRLRWTLAETWLRAPAE